MCGYTDFDALDKIEMLSECSLQKLLEFIGRKLWAYNQITVSLKLNIKNQSTNQYSMLIKHLQGHHYI